VHVQQAVAQVRQHHRRDADVVGVTGPRFWQKQCPDTRPDWLPTAPVWSRDKRAYIEYCVADELPALLWAVNIGSRAARPSSSPARGTGRAPGW
jgi:DNA primase